MPRPIPSDRNKPSTSSLFTKSCAPPSPPQVLLINKFTESRAPELESLHSIVSARLNHDFCLRRDKRRRTNGFRRGVNQRRKWQRLADGAADAVRDVKAEAPDSDGKEKKLSRRVRRRLELQRNPALGFCASQDGTKRLRTHLWHAKRFTMVKRWGFYLPLGVHGKGKGSRAVLKWLKSGALVHDASYIHHVQLEGPEDSIMEIMSMVLRPLPSGVSLQISSPVVHGICYANSMLYHVRSTPPKLIAPVSYMWRPLKRGGNSMNSEQLDGCSSSSRSVCNTLLRQLWIWIHPASYNEGFGALRCACQNQMNETGIPVRCISMEGHVARLEIIGAKSLEILQKILNPIPELHRIGTQSQSLLGCPFLSECSNSRLQSHFLLENAPHLPPRAILSLAVQDPRDLPVKETKLFPTTNSFISCPQQDGLVQDSTDKISVESTGGDKDLILSLWSEPEENGVILSDCRYLWDSSIKLKPPLPEKFICNEKHRKRLELFYLDSSHFGEPDGEARDGYDRSCHILLLRHADSAINLGWSLLLPLCWVKPFWMSLISNGAHAIGLREKRWIACNSGLPTFPYDFPDSRAYSSLMTAEAATASETAKLRPPAFRPIAVPLAPPWDCVVHTLNRESNVDKSCHTDSETPHGLSLNIESENYKQLYPEHAEEPFKFSISRTSSILNYQLGKIGCTRYLEQAGGPCFVRVIMHAFKEGSFEEGAVVCAPTLADLPAWMSRSEEHEPLQMPQSFIKSYFSKQGSGKWELQVPEKCSTLKWYRWPIGFITTGFVQGSSKPMAVAFCESSLLERLKAQQACEIKSAGPEIFVFVRNLKSTTYRRALATVFVDLQGEDLDFL